MKWKQNEKKFVNNNKRHWTKKKKQTFKLKTFQGFFCTEKNKTFHHDYLLKYFQSQGHNHHYRLAIFYIMVMVMVMFFFVVGWQNLRWSRNRICRMCDNNNNNDGDDGLCIFFMPNKKKCPDSPQRWSMNIPKWWCWMNEWTTPGYTGSIKLIIITNRLNWLIQLKSIHDYWCHWSFFILFLSMRWLNIGQDQIHDFQYLTLK